MQTDSLQQTTFRFWLGNPTAELVSGSVLLVALPDLPFEAVVKAERERESTSATMALLPISREKGVLEVCRLLLDWSGEIEECKVVTIEQSRHYGLFLQFRSGPQADLFRRRMIGAPFNPIEDDRLIVREVRELDCITDEFSLQLPRLRLRKSEGETKMHFFRKTPQDNCAICLEALGEGGLILTILCNHSYHEKCLRQWKDSKCPQCRYHQHPPVIQYCAKCSEEEGLWLCLTCGEQLCGGDSPLLQSHTREHFLETRHKLAMELEAKVIYDFERKDYVHRLMQQHLNKDKLTLKNLEQFMARELEEQRLYFEARVAELALQLRERENCLSELAPVLADQLIICEKELAQEQCLLGRQGKLLQRMEKEEARNQTEMRLMSVRSESILEELGRKEQQLDVEVERELRETQGKLKQTRLQIKDLQRHLSLMERLRGKVDTSNPMLLLKKKR